MKQHTLVILCGAYHRYRQNVFDGHEDVKQFSPDMPTAMPANVTIPQRMCLCGLPVCLQT